MKSNEFRNHSMNENCESSHLIMFYFVDHNQLCNAAICKDITIKR